MKHSVPKRRDPYKMLQAALETGWSSVEDIPLKGEGLFMVLTVSGLVRYAKNRNKERRFRRADGYGPMRATVVAVDSGNYLGAIAWRWPDEHAGTHPPPMD